MLSASAIEAALAREGLVTCTVEKSATRELLKQLGDIVEETRVRQRSEAHTYLAGRDAVPLHTDHPEADLVAWRCEVQDRQDGASVLADGYAIIQAMGASADSLRGVELYVPPQLSRQTPDRGTVWDGKRLYYAPWYPIVRAGSDGRRALRLFTNLLAMGFGHRRVRLKAGELLIVDNGRWLHGRDKLPEKGNRFLQRYWLRRQSYLSKRST